MATLESRMAHIARFGRDQLRLMPEAVDDKVEADNSVRFIDVFVDGLERSRQRVSGASRRRRRGVRATRRATC